MPSLKDFIDALQAGWFVALTIFVGSSIILAGDYWNIQYLNESPGWLITSAVVAGVFSFSVLIANIAYIPVKIWQWFKKRSAKKNFNKEIYSMIERAPREELFILFYLAKSGRRAFNAEFNDRRISPLVSKGIIIRMPGAHSVLEWPYVVRQEAWDILLEHRDEVQIEMPPDGHDPFNWRSW
jgi:hypothetical protein